MAGSIQLATEIPGPKSREILRRKGKSVSNSIVNHVEAVIDHGRGAMFTDVDGNTHLDFSSGMGCLLVGYSHPKVVAAVKRQVERFSHTDFSVIPYESFVQVAERLTARVGGNRKAALFSTGSEAIENAVKFARAFTRRPAIICFEGGFHGLTLLTMTLTSSWVPYKLGFGPFAPEVYRLPFSYPYRDRNPSTSGRDALEHLERALTTTVDPSTVAAVIFEPEQGLGGCVVPAPDFLPGIERLCREQGILTIVDEIQTGCGRTGRFLASEHFGLNPDLIILAKAFTGGYPLAAVVGRADVMDAPAPSAIGGTYIGNPVACAAAVAALEVIDEENLIDRADIVGGAIRATWEDIAEDVRQVGDIRGLGSMIGVEFVEDRDTKTPSPGYLRRFMAETQRRGLVTVGAGIYRNVLRHLPALTITDAQLDEALAVIRQAAAAAAHG
jgi:4-aminobutyrate aminotransferase/(S)-3-amino-2-methylpropionate transaminase